MDAANNRNNKENSNLTTGKEMDMVRNRNHNGKRVIQLDTEPGNDPSGKAKSIQLLVITVSVKKEVTQRKHAHADKLSYSSISFTYHCTPFQWFPNSWTGSHGSHHIVPWGPLQNYWCC